MLLVGTSYRALGLATIYGGYFRLPSRDVVILLYRILAYYCCVIFYFLFFLFSLYKLIPWATYVRLIILWLLIITTII